MKRRYRSLILTAAALLAAFLVSKCFYQLMLIEGDSMCPTYRNLELVVLDKTGKEYTAGQVIAFRCDELSSVLVKRVVAVPGDTVVIRDGTLLINDQISDIFATEGCFEYAGILSESQKLGADAYVVIGDNIQLSKDSRYEQVGIVHGEDIIGRVVGS